MNSKVADAIALETHAIALVWADAAPQGATRFKQGRWGCVVALFAAVAAKGRVGPSTGRPTAAGVAVSVSD